MDTETIEAGIGHNSGDEPAPTVLARADSIIATGNKWITERPKITDQEMADKAAAFLKQGRHAIKVIDEARKVANKPWDEKIDENNRLHNGKRDLLNKILSPLATRLDTFFTEQKRVADEIARKAREAAQTAAAEAERLRREEEEALEKAKNALAVGTFDDVSARIQASAEAEQRAKQAEQEAKAAEKVQVKAGGEHFIGESRRAITQRTVETPIVKSAALVLRAVGTNDQIDAALITAARAYKKLKGKWPAGIEIETSTKV